MRLQLPLSYRAALGILFSFLLSLPALGKEWYVPDDFPTIQSALDSPLVKDGDTVTVRPGTYQEAIDFKGKKVTLTSEAGPAVTVIDGDGKGTVVTFAAGEDESAVLEGFTVTGGHGGNAGGVLCMNASPTLRNNVITGNRADGNAGGVMVVLGAPVITENVIEHNEALGTYGGGIYLESSDAVITKNIVRNNTTGWEAGGIYCSSFSCPLIEDNTIEGNHAYMGGGIFCCMSSPVIKDNLVRENYGEAAAGGICSKNYSSPLITGNVIEANRANLYYGGGIFCATSAAVITKNIIRNNTAPQGGGACFQYLPSTFTDNHVTHNAALHEGGGICCLESDSILVGNVIRENTAESGGGIWCIHASPIVTGNTVYGNTATIAGGGIGTDADGFPAVMNSIVWENTPDALAGVSLVCYCDVEGGYFGPGNLDADPLFVDPAAGDLHIARNSPCRNAGFNGAAYLPDEDFEDDPRIAEGATDMGADEFHLHLYGAGDFTPGGAAVVRVVGTPGAQVTLWAGSGVLDPPIPTAGGDWYLAFPLLLELPLGAVPGPAGVLSLPFTVPPDLPVPLTLPLQTLVGEELSNPCVLEFQA